MYADEIGVIFLTIIQIPSFCFIVYIFFQYIQQASPLRRFQNHLLMYLLIVATWTITIELPNVQVYFWTRSATIHTSWFCSLWNASYFSTATLNRILMAIMCIERYFLVFRPQLYRTRRSRLLFHYTPLVFIVSITLIYLIITNIFISCPQLHFYYSAFLCGYTCSVLTKNFATFYIWILVFIPTITTVISSILLPIRFIIQKGQLQRVQWHRSRKMIVQTSIISSVYILCWLPFTIVLQLLTNNILSFANPNIIRYFAVVPYMTSLLTPFIVFHTIRKPLPIGIMERLKRRLFLRRRDIVQPANNFVAQQLNPPVIDDQNSIPL
jgi:hypothetical protein